PSSRGSGFWPFVTTAGTSVGETANSARQVDSCGRSGTLSCRIAGGATATRATSRPSTEATTVVGLVNSDGSLWSETITDPPRHASLVYVTAGPDQVSCEYRPSTRETWRSGP